MHRLALLLLLLASLPAFAQPRPIPVENVPVESRILDEIRTAWVQLPRSYATSRQRYPVVVFTDAESNFGFTAATVDYLARTGRMPEAILVGVTNNDRTRDLTPTRADFDQHPTSGGAPRFLTFIETELLPDIDRRFRTTPYRVFIGHSLGGLLALDALFTRPKLFDALIAISPSLTWDDRWAFKQASALIESNKLLNNTLVLTMANEGEAPRREFDALSTLLGAHPVPGLEFTPLSFDDEDHGSTVMPAEYAGLKAVFASWRFVADARANPLTLMRAAELHYERLSKRAGVTMPIPESTINVIGYRLLATGHTPEAIDVFKRNTELYPGSANVWDSVGEAYEKSGDVTSARESYAKAVKLATKSRSGDVAIYRQHLARVTP